MLNLEKYNHNYIEEKWQKIWEKTQLYKTDEFSNSKNYYILEMFLYPSGNIHMGHVRNYAIGDAIARYKKAKGYNILHPMGWDAFGLPAENAAIHNKLHPNQWTLKNIASMKAQLKLLGFSYDWTREINTSSPEYYKHEQIMFIDFYNAGLAYQKKSLVNWDPVDCTVLANEQVIDGKGWRSGAKVQRKELKQWFLKITNYADELLNDLDNLVDWPDKVKNMQKNWIGKSEGTKIKFKVADSNKNITILTTRPETLFGATFICISYDHTFVKEINNTDEKLEFIAECKLQYESSVIQEDTEKKGFFTNTYVEHPYLKNKKIPIYISNYVIPGHGTGALFGCPAHDKKDYDFAKKYNLEILPVILPEHSKDLSLLPYTEPFGVIINSDFLNNLKVADARIKIIEKIESDNIGQTVSLFKLRDWGVSRQRYWGCPIPIIYCGRCGTIPESKDNLPIKLPDQINLNGKGNPLDNDPEWKNIKCHVCGGNATRETDTFDTFFESSWYFARFCSLDENLPFKKNDIEKWLPVEQYIGGIEHAILHLLYARFFTKALRDCGYFNIKEPFRRLLTQGMICHKTFRDKNHNWLSPDSVYRKGDDWLMKGSDDIVIGGRIEKMSKSKKNTVNPTEMLKKYGADSTRMFLLSDSPPSKDLEWSDKGIESCYKYLNSIYNLVYTFLNTEQFTPKSSSDEVLMKIMNETIQLVDSNLEQIALNKVIANIRSFSNVMLSLECSKPTFKKALLVLIKLLSLFAPHISEELNEMLLKDYKQSIYQMSWPTINKKFLVNKIRKVAVQINGKTRTIIDLPVDCSQEEAIQHINKVKKLDEYIFNKKFEKIIYVKNKIINFVTGITF